MPNHIINTIRLTGDQEKISELLESVKDNRFGIGSLDFNKVIPMPESLQIETGSSMERGLKAYKQFIDIYTLNEANKDLLNIPEDKRNNPTVKAYNQSVSDLLNKKVMFAYCVIKMFFANIKRGGILLIQIAVGSLYMFSVPRGYADGFNQWCKQVIAICLTAFMQTTLLFLGLMTFPNNMLLGLGIMLAANEVPRIAQQFGLDSSVRVNMMSVVHATTTAVNLTRSVAKAAGK